MSKKKGVNITLDISKNVAQNAETYFEKAKKSKKKVQGAVDAIDKAKKQIEKLEKEKKTELEKQEKKLEKKKKKRKKHWYEKFRWFITSDGFLVIGGRDATSNEIIIKKHTDKDDIVLHTDMSGSPFFVIKSQKKKISESALAQAADAACSYSRAWKLGLRTQSVFYVKPEQVTKQAQPGEYLPKGAFMIRGETKYIDNKINLAIGLTDEGAVMGGPVEAVSRHCRHYVQLEQGDEKASKTAKFIQSVIGGDLDEIIRAMPAGGVKVKK